MSSSSRRRRLVALLDRRLARRLLIAPLTVIAAVVGVCLSPVVLLVAALRKRVRLALLVVGALVIETIGMITSLMVWILTGFGFLGTDRWRWHLHRSFMGRYASTMLSLVVKVISSSIEWRDRADLSTGPVVVIARHTSFFDALIPATLICRRNALLAHHVVTHGLRYAPCIDIVGHRFPNRFIKRTPGEGSKELVHIEAIGAVLDERSSAIIFPEGTFRNPERFERVVRRLRRREPELAARASALTHVLPPRSNGTLALLDGCPTADVVVCANTGFEPFGSIKDIVRRPVADRPIIVETWRIPRAEIPSDPADFNQWLFDQYVAIDAWVGQQNDERPVHCTGL